MESDLEVNGNYMPAPESIESIDPQLEFYLGKYTKYAT